MRKIAALINFISGRVLSLCLGLFICLFLLESGLWALGKGYLYLQQKRNRTGGADAEYTIMCFGESMTINTYPEFLEEALNERYKPHRFSVIDKAMSSSDSDYIVSILDESLDAHNPDMVIVMAGINDNKDPVLYRDYHRKDKLSFLKRSRVYRLVRFLLIDLQRKSEKGKSKFAESVLAPMAQEAGGDERGGSRAEDIYLNIVALLDDGQMERACGMYKKSYLPVAGPEDMRRHFKVLVYKMLSPLGLGQEAEALVLKVLKKYPDNYDAHACLVDSWAQLGKFEHGEQFYNSLMETDDSYLPYVMLSALFMYKEDFDACEKVLLKGIKRRGLEMPLYERLLEIYRIENRFDDYRALAQQMYDSGRMNRERFCADMIFCAREQGRSDEVEKYTRLMRKYHSDYVHPKTERNLRFIARTVLGRGAVLIFMQYPMRDVRALEKMAGEFKGRIFFVDNEDVFKRAVMEQGFGAVFKDNFAGDFGHLTPGLGYLLIVENIIRQLEAGPFARFTKNKTDA